MRKRAREVVGIKNEEKGIQFITPTSGSAANSKSCRCQMMTTSQQILIRLNWPLLMHYFHPRPILFNSTRLGSIQWLEVEEEAGQQLKFNSICRWSEKDKASEPSKRSDRSKKHHDDDYRKLEASERAAAC